MSTPAAESRAGLRSAWLLAIRPLTLPASAAPVVLGWAAAAAVGSTSIHLGLVCLGTAITLQIAANLANDLFDGLSGVDSSDRLGPKRVTQSGLLRPGQVLAGLIATLGLASILGIYAVLVSGWWLLILGAACLIGALAYTAGPLPLARLGLGELAALVFFGPVACTGTFAVLHGAPTPAAWAAGLVPGLHAAAIMAVNNLRDIESDTRAGKMTLAVRLGERGARRLAAALLISGNLAVVPFALVTGRPLLWAALLLVPASIPLIATMLRTPRSRALNAVLARTGRWELFTCLVLASLLLF